MYLSAVLNLVQILLILITELNHDDD